MPPEQLTAWFHQDEVELAWEPLLLHQEYHAIIDVFPEELSLNVLLSVDGLLKES